MNRAKPKGSAGLKAENARLRAEVAGLDRALRRINALADLSCELLESLVERFADDPKTQARLREAVADVADQWGDRAALLGEACRNSEH